MTFLLIFGFQSADAWVWVFISASADWQTSIGSSQLSGFPGSDFVPQIESPANVSTINLFSNSGWRLDVQRTGISWPKDIGLKVRASSSSADNGWITASSDYITVSEVPTELATGTPKRWRIMNANIGLQYQIDQLSVDIGAAVYTTSVIFTVTEQ